MDSIHGFIHNSNPKSNHRQINVTKVVVHVITGFGGKDCKILQTNRFLNFFLIFFLSK